MQISCYVTDAPIVTIVQGERVSRNESEALTLTCEADAKPSEVTYEWIKGKRGAWLLVYSQA